METITEEFVKKLKPPDRGQRIVWDDKIPGFGVRITAAGTIAFILNYTSGDKSSNGKKKRKRVKIGRYPAWNATIARKKAGELSVGIDNGKDPLEERRQSDSEPTFGELAQRYLDDYAQTHKRKSSIRNDKGKIKHLLPRWEHVESGRSTKTKSKSCSVSSKQRRIRPTAHSPFSPKCSISP